MSTSNVFISHRHKDDKSVTDLTNLLAGKGYSIRNSSIRVNSKNAERLEEKKVDRKVIERLLKMKMAWAGTVVVLIGPKTHSSEWVNWEIEEANRQSKRIIGVFMHGAKDSDIPQSLEDYGDGLVGWNSDKIIAALNGEDVGWCNSSGESRQPSSTLNRKC